jgi:hypothetical protein
MVVCRRERDWVLGEFKAGRSPILIATDVASRGLGTFFYFASAPCKVPSNNPSYPDATVGFFTSTFLLPGLRVRIRSKTGLTDNARTANRGDPLSLLCFPLTCSLAHYVLFRRRSRVYPNEHFCRSWSAFGYGLRCSRSWDFDNRLLSMPALARKRSCLSTSWTRRGSIMCYPSHVETSPGHLGDGCLMFNVPAVEALVS